MVANSIVTIVNIEGRNGLRRRPPTSNKSGAALALASRLRPRAWGLERFGTRRRPPAPAPHCAAPDFDATETYRSGARRLRSAGCLSGA